MVLLDSNIIIYAFKTEAPQLVRLVDNPDASVSATTYVEVLGFHRLTPLDRSLLEELF
jgi:predicted nucleic acid-binding protein